MRKNMKRHSNKILSAIGACLGAALSNIDMLQGVLPNGWYIGLFVIVFIVDFWIDHG